MPSDPRPFQDPLPVPPVLKPYATGPDGALHFRLPIRNGRARFHRDLPETGIWGYWGATPGPTIEVDHRAKVVVELTNELQGPYPFSSIVAKPTAKQLEPLDFPGRSGVAAETLPDLRWTVLHLHGSPTPPPYDGWPDDAFFPGQSQTYHFPPQPRAALLWYHDHANMITRLNVYAGLAGLYLVRDDLEKSLGLPMGPPYELPLLIQDRNLDVDEQTDTFTGQLLYKTNTSGNFFGPYTAVNGVIWPYHKVEPRQYRFRVLNGSNGRIYRLKLKLPNGQLSTAEFIQVGVDLGFLPRPVPIPNTEQGNKRGLLLAPAERADLLVDFSAYAGQNLVLVNEDERLQRQQIIEFRVGTNTPGKPVTLPASLPTVPPLDAKSAAKTRQVVLTKDEPHHPGAPAMQMINGKLFRDTVEEVVELGDVEIWEFVNTTVEVHPMHLHLVHFEVLGREEFEFDEPTFKKGIDGWLRTLPDKRPKMPPGVTPSGMLLPPDPNECGPKDTVRAPPKVITRVIARFEPFAGRYVYHCHILEHEDMEMMRPFLVIPKGLPQMDHGGHT
jgi:FtsP/CotA-like multicopper oxidase with cupredoxin domain